jgi:transcriptional regulator with XRE-family HTH domain
MKDIHQKFVQNFKKYRELRGWSQGEVSRRLGVDKSYICRIEKGQVNPTLTNINKLAHVLGVEAWEMLK